MASLTASIIFVFLKNLDLRLTIRKRKIMELSFIFVFIRNLIPIFLIDIVFFFFNRQLIAL